MIENIKIDVDHNGIVLEHSREEREVDRRCMVRVEPEGSLWIRLLEILFFPLNMAHAVASRRGDAPVGSRMVRIFIGTKADVRNWVVDNTGYFYVGDLKSIIAMAFEAKLCELGERADGD